MDRWLRGLAAAGLVLAGGSTGCDNLSTDQVISIDARGVVGGFVFRDENGTGVFESRSDTPFSGLPVKLLLAGTRTVVASAVTDQAGVFTLQDVPVGTYRLQADDAFLSDSLQVLVFDSLGFVIGAQDSVVVTMGLTYPKRTVAEIKAMPAGKRVFTDGVALNNRSTFADGSVHVTSGGVAIRSINVTPIGLLSGDSVRFLGLTARDRGQPVLDRVTPLILGGFGTLPSAREVTTGVAARADGGSLDAGLAKVAGATVQDTATVGADFVVTVDDGSGPLEVFFDGTVGSFVLTPVIPGARLRSLTGLLAPTDPQGGGPRWRLKPRFGSDVDVAPVGGIRGTVFFDADGDTLKSVADPLFAGLLVSLKDQGTGQVIRSDTSDVNGVFEFERLDPKNYDLVVDSASAALGDSLRVVHVEKTVITVVANQTVGVNVGVGYPKFTIPAARVQPPGRRIWVSGLAMNNRNAFGDATVHLWNGNRAIRATNVQPVIVSPEDTVRMLGTTSTLDGQPTLDQVTLIRIGSRIGLFAIEVMTTTVAASADNGRLDAAPARVRNAVIVDTLTVSTDFTITADDGSGPVTVVLDGSINFNLGIYTPGKLMDATGLLVPASPPGSPPRWILKPRSPSDTTVR